MEHVGERLRSRFRECDLLGHRGYVEDLVERHSVLLQFQSRLRHGGAAAERLGDGAGRKRGAVAITVTCMTGRRRAGKDSVSWEWEA